jgi:CheY-like chemotaxis protein
LLYHRARRWPVQVKVLLVDDSPLILKAAELFLKGNYQILTATSGREALEKAAHEQPDLIVMDFHMPGWSGRETRFFLARDPRTRNIPVILMTTAGDPDLVSTETDLLVKPFGPRDLNDKIARYVRPS